MKPLTKATARLLAPIKLQPNDRLELQLQKDADQFTVRIYSIDIENGKEKKALASWEARNVFIERIPERSRLGRDGGGSGWVESWSAGATDTTVAVISALWPVKQIIFKDADTVTMFNYLVTSSLNYDFAAELSAHYQETKQAPPAAFPKRDDVSLAPYQVTATSIALRVEAFSLFMAMGCLAPDSEVNVHRAGRSFRMTIADLHFKFNGGRRRYERGWDKTIPTKIRCLRADGTVGLAEIGFTTHAGRQEMLKITLETGESVKCTHGHEMVTPSGKVRADSLAVGDLLLTAPIWRNSPAEYTGPCSQTLSDGRYVDKDGYCRAKAGVKTVGCGEQYEHRALMEIELGRELLIGEVVHHKNGVRHDNRIENLELHGSNSTHLAERHSFRGNLPGAVTVARKIKSIESAGVDDVYDINVQDEVHTYVANGIIVGNTGKSSVVVTRLCADAIRNLSGKSYKVLIVCPKNVRMNWVDEIEKFKTCDGRTTVIRGGALDRVKCLIDAFSELKSNEKFTAVVVAYDSMVRMMPALRSVEWDLAVLDEGHYIKSSKTKRAHGAMELRDISKKRMLLTGSPITNTPLDLYSQLEFLGKGFSGFRSFAAFAKFYGVFAKNEQTGMSKLIAFQNMPFMKERLARYSFIITKEQALPNLPAKVHDVIEVQMSVEQTKVYEDLRDTLAAEIENQLNNAGDNAALVVTNVLVKLLRLAQITSGFLPLQEEILQENGEYKLQKDVYRFDPNPKLEALVEALKEDFAESDNNKSIVWACWVQDIKQIRARLEIEGINCVTYYGQTKDEDRENAIKSFNTDPNCRVFIGNAAAGGTGVNLLGYDARVNGDSETNCNHVYYYSQDWSAVKRAQSEDRAHRRGTRAPVRITDLCVPNSIDEEIRARVLKKRIMAMEIADVRELLRSLLKGVLTDDA